MVKHVNFIENPAVRTPVDKPVGCVTAGQRWDSVFIEVSTATYITKHFREWLDNSVMPRLMPGGSIRIAILSPEVAN